MAACTRQRGYPRATSILLVVADDPWTAFDVGAELTFGISHPGLSFWKLGAFRSARYPIGETVSEATLFDRITFDSDIMGGRACIRGMRIPVSLIVSQIAHGASFEEILEEYPDLEREDIQQAIEYAAWLTREEVRSS